MLFRDVRFIVGAKCIIILLIEFNWNKKQTYKVDEDLIVYLQKDAIIYK